MIAISFPEANDVLKKPGKMTHEQVADQPVWIGMGPVDEGGTESPLVISVWRPSKEDIEALIAGGSIYQISVGSTVDQVRKGKDGKLTVVKKIFGGITQLTTENPFK